MPDELIHCPNPLCNDEGWYAEGSWEDGWEQVQCEFCWTNPLSYYNAFQQGVQADKCHSCGANIFSSMKKCDVCGTCR